MTGHDCAAAQRGSTGVILAGGRARRLGGLEKSTLRVGGTTILERQIAVLRNVTSQLLIVCRDPDRYAGVGVPAVTDVVSDAGALGGLYTGLVTSSTRQVLVVACDMPFLTPGFLDHLLAAGREADAAVPRTADGYHPLCASYQRNCAAAIRRRIDRGALKVTDALSDFRIREIGTHELAVYDPDGRLLLNVNTPSDYARALDLAGHR